MKHLVSSEVSQWKFALNALAPIQIGRKLFWWSLFLYLVEHVNIQTSTTSLYLFENKNEKDLNFVICLNADGTIREPKVILDVGHVRSPLYIILSGAGFIYIILSASAFIYWIVRLLYDQFWVILLSSISRTRCYLPIDKGDPLWYDGSIKAASTHSSQQRWWPNVAKESRIGHCVLFYFRQLRSYQTVWIGR